MIQKVVCAQEFNRSQYDIDSLIAILGPTGDCMEATELVSKRALHLKGMRHDHEGCSWQSKGLCYCAL